MNFLHRKFFSYFFIIFFFIYTPLWSAQTNVVNLVSKVRSTVVSIYAADYKSGIEVDNFFNSNTPLSNKKISIGSGVIISEEGYIVTNNHLLKKNNNIKVVLDNGKIFKAEEVFSNPSLDLSILKIETQEKLSAIKIATSKGLNVGSRVYAIGNPYGIGPSVSSGIISALPSVSNRILSNMGNFIQIDAALNPGNSGGALINEKGELIGINTAIFSPSGTSAGIGFAIPSDVVEIFIKKSLENREFVEYWLGFSVVNLSFEKAESAGLSNPQGIIIKDVYANGPAEKAGLKEEDIIIEFDGEEIIGTFDLSYLLAHVNSSDTKKMLIYRDGKVLNISINPEIPDNSGIDEKILLLKNGFLQGIYVSNNSHSKASSLGITYEENSLVVEQVEPNSRASQLGLRRGDIIIQINDSEALSTDNLVSLLESSASKIYVKAKRGGGYFEISLSQTSS